jgi:hypothetical protein
MYAQQRHEQAQTAGMKPRRGEPTPGGKVKPDPNPVWQSLATRHFGIQTKLSVSRPGDASEREADRAADAVLRGQAVSVYQSAASAPVQRMCSACEDEQNAHACPECESERQEETTVQAKRASGVDGQAVGGARQLATLEGRGQALPDALRGEFEPRFGRDFGDVRLHTDAQAAASASAFDALAFTYGRHVVFGPGQFDPSSTSGLRLIAHELAHVVQQSTQGRPALQRQPKPKTFGGPLDLKPDLCITAPDPIGTVCGSDAAKACSKFNLPGCGPICSFFGCDKPEKPTARGPPGWRAAGSKGFEGLCCRGGIDNAESCCPPSQIAIFDNRCCKPGEVVVNNRCDCPPSQKAMGGRCCEPPQVPEGMSCVPPKPAPLPEPKPKPEPTPTPTPTPKPKPAPPTPTSIFFKRDRPSASESNAPVASVTTGEGKTNFDALVARLKAEPALRVQLVGRASPEGDEAYNLELGARRARLIADALKAAGVPGSQIADPPDAAALPGCQSLGPGLATCGEAGAKDDKDRQVTARVFQSATP